MSRLCPSDVNKGLADEFLESIAASPQAILCGAINFITVNYEPEEVYDLKVLEEWARNNNYVRDVEDQ